MPTDKVIYEANTKYASIIRLEDSSNEWVLPFQDENALYTTNYMEACRFLLTFHIEKRSKLEEELILNTDTLERVKNWIFHGEKKEGHF